jgi:subtilisin family serine protease
LFWIGQLGLEPAWQVSKGADVVVGLIDTGVDATEPDLAGAVAPGAEFPDLGAGTGDPHGHGTTMALLIRGAAPEAKILPVRLNGGASEANDAIRWAVDHGAKVINLSLGRSSGQSDVYDAGLAYARSHDVVVVAAAGNVATDTGVTSPADREGVLAVSAVDRAGRFREDVSVQGTSVDLAAPGVEITTSRRGESGPTSGTSQAAALVSGVAALVRSRYPDLDAAEVAERLTGTAKDAGTPGHDPRYGYGIVDPVAALAEPDSPGRWAWPLAGGLVLAAGAVVFFVVRRHPRAGRRTAPQRR